MTARTVPTVGDHTATVPDPVASQPPGCECRQHPTDRPEVATWQVVFEACCVWKAGLPAAHWCHSCLQDKLTRTSVHCAACGHKHTPPVTAYRSLTRLS